jgi:CTP:molybdopterin cytidylyltransferase MocA|tara:strand:- start:125 stop:676 length:552 start_codon:yes stop_codon:yes gene_type:complete
MGEPKALMEVMGKTFVQRAVDTLSLGGCAPVVVVVPNDSDIESAAHSTHAHVLVNHNPGEGPITSLRLALRELTSQVDGIIYLPVDHPLVHIDTIRQLLAVAGESSAPLVIPTYLGNRGHPSFFRANLFTELNDPTLDGGARTVVHRYLSEANLIPVDDSGVLADIDTPESYECALQQASELP